MFSLWRRERTLKAQDDFMKYTPSHFLKTTTKKNHKNVAKSHFIKLYTS